MPHEKLQNIVDLPCDDSVTAEARRVSQTDLNLRKYGFSYAAENQSFARPTALQEAGALGSSPAPH